MLTSRYKNQRGISLVEAAVTLVIAGVILAGGLTALNAYWQNQLREKQQTRFTRVQQAIGAFVYKNGRYPCATYNDLSANDANYGQEICDTAKYATTAGQCRREGAVVDNAEGFGLCVQRGMRGGNPNANVEVWRGMLPFKTLGISEEYAYDVYGSRLVYAVSAAMTSVYDTLNPTTTFGLQNGAIRVRKFDLNRKPNAILDEAVNPVGSAHFVVIAPGKNRGGGINARGQRIVACADMTDDAGNQMGATTDERKQCNISQNADYFAHNYNAASLTANTAKFDDKVMYFASSDPNTWSSGADVHVEADKLGLGSNDPQYTLDVAGDVRVQKDVIVGAGINTGTAGFNPNQVASYDADCTTSTPKKGISKIPPGWDDLQSPECKSPTLDFDCGSDSTGKRKIFTGFKTGVPVCARRDGKCDGIVHVICPNTSSQKVVNLIGNTYEPGQEYPGNGDVVRTPSGIVGVDVEYYYKCEAGIMKPYEASIGIPCPPS